MVSLQCMSISYSLLQSSCALQDNDMDSSASIKADFASDYVQSLLSLQVFDYIHASPVCTTYTHLAGGKHRDKDNHNKTAQSYEADGMLMVLYFFLAKALKTNPDATCTIENPRGFMKRGNIMVSKISSFFWHIFSKLMMVVLCASQYQRTSSMKSNWDLSDTRLLKR